MIPSRGLRVSTQASSLASRRLLSNVNSTRQFSYSTVQNAPSRASPFSSKHASPLLRISSFSRANLIIRNGAGVRFASTTPVPPTTPLPSTAAPIDATPVDPGLSLDFSQLALDPLNNIPVQLGYLKALGLEYGFGPTSMMQWVLEHVHVLAGTPWWASIAITAFLARAVLFKAYMNASDMSARMVAVKHITDPLRARILEAQKSGDNMAMQELRVESQMVLKRAGVKMWRGFVPMLQVFTGYGTWKLLRGMSILPVPGFDDGGLFWFYNLSLPDPLYLLPFGTAVAMHFALRKGGETGTSTMSPTMTKVFMWGFPALSFAFTFWLPAAVQLSFFSTSALTYLQTTLFQNPKFRERMSMYPMPKNYSPLGEMAKSLESELNKTTNVVRTVPLSQSEISGLHKPAVSVEEGRKRGGIRGYLDSKMAEARDTVKSVTAAGKETVDTAKSTFAKDRKTDEEKEAAAYEKQRSAEIKAQKEAEDLKRARTLESRMHKSPAAKKAKQQAKLAELKTRNRANR